MRLTNVGAAPSRIRRCPRPGARIQSGPSHAAKGGAPPPPTIMAITSALPRLLKAAAAPAMTWLPLNVVIVDNDRAGDSPSSYRARALRASAQEVSRRYRLDTCKVAAVARDPAVEPERARWHDPVLSPGGLGSRPSSQHSD
jgi:hypothetical protein